MSPKKAAVYVDQYKVPHFTKELEKAGFVVTPGEDHDNGKAMMTVDYTDETLVQLTHVLNLCNTAILNRN